MKVAETCHCQRIEAGSSREAVQYDEDRCLEVDKDIGWQRYGWMKKDQTRFTRSALQRCYMEKLDFETNTLGSQRLSKPPERTQHPMVVERSPLADKGRGDVVLHHDCEVVSQRFHPMPASQTGSIVEVQAVYEGPSPRATQKLNTVLRRAHGRTDPVPRP